MNGGIKMRPVECIVALFFLSIPALDAVFAQGSLQLVFHPRSGKSSVLHPQTATLGHLWCQAAVNNLNGDATEIVPIKAAHFIHFTGDHPDRPIPARIEKKRAYLDFGPTNVTAIGKYRCEMTTENDESVYGNMFVYSRPIFHTNGSMRLDIPDSEKNYELVGSSTKAIRGKTALLVCPARGFPQPEFHWQKDGQPLENSEKHQIIRNELYIRDADDADEGIYRCIASNEFPPHIDFKEQRFEAILDQQLRVTSSLSFLIPLVVIFIISILLVVFIYTCAYLKRRESQRYNVASAENKLKNAEEQRLRDADDDE